MAREPRTSPKIECIGSGKVCARTNDVIVCANDRKIMATGQIIPNISIYVDLHSLQRPANSCDLLAEPVQIFFPLCVCFFLLLFFHPLVCTAFVCEELSILLVNRGKDEVIRYYICLGYN